MVQLCTIFSVLSQFISLCFTSLSNLPHFITLSDVTLSFLTTVQLRTSFSALSQFISLCFTSLSNLPHSISFFVKCHPLLSNRGPIAYHRLCSVTVYFSVFYYFTNPSNRPHFISLFIECYPVLCTSVQLCTTFPVLSV